MLNAMWFEHTVLPTLLMAVTVFCYCSAVFTEQDEIHEITEADAAGLARQRRATCGSYVCKNGGVCVTSPSVLCLCPMPYVNFDCAIAGNYCELPQEDKGISLPVCLNGGTCIPFKLTSPYFTCSCVSGYNGIRCETNIDDCASKPCVNGQCTDLVNDYRCSCYAGWEGRQCSVDTNYCLPMPCLNGGRCMDGNSTFTCDCSAIDYTGVTCSSKINDCQPNPCFNSGICTDGLRSYTCTCNDTGSYGRNCSLHIDDCSPNPCMNSATCTDLVNNYTCSCHAGYTGRNCSTDIVDCTENTCDNGGTCYERSNLSLYKNPSLPSPFNGSFSYLQAAGFLCVCQLGYSGSNCSVDFPDCSPNPCEPNGICFEKSKVVHYNLATMPSPFNRPFNVSQAIGFMCLYPPSSGSPASNELNAATVAGITAAVLILLSVSIFLILLSQIGKGNISLGVFEKRLTTERLKSDGEKLPLSSVATVASPYLIPDRDVDAQGNERMYDNPVNITMQNDDFMEPQSHCETAPDAVYVGNQYMKPDTIVNKGNWLSPPIPQINPHLVTTSANTPAHNGDNLDDVYDEAGQHVA